MFFVVNFPRNYLIDVDGCPCDKGTTGRQPGKKRAEASIARHVTRSVGTARRFLIDKK